MKNYLRLLTPMMLLLAVVFGGGKTYADEVTYTIASATSVTASKSLTGVTATFKNTYTNNKEQLTNGNNMTLTIKGFTGKIGSFVLNQAATKTGEGELKITVNGSSVVSKTFVAKELGTSASNFTERTYSVETPVATTGDVVITLSATKNSLYCRSFKLVYEDADDNRTATSLTFGSDVDNKEFDFTAGDAFDSPVATLSPSTVSDPAIVYSSSNEKVAKVDAETGAVTLGKSAGQAVITASYAGNDSYKPSSCSYTINLAKSSTIIDGFFDFDNTIDYGSGLTPSNSTTYIKSSNWTAGNVTITTSGGSGIRWWNANDGNELRVYSSTKMAISVPNGYVITNIDLGVYGSMNVDCGTLTKSKWTGASQVVTITPTATKNFKNIEVTYKKNETLTTAASGYATYFADYATNYSEAGLTAFTVKVNGDKVVATEYTGVVPAGAAVLVKGEASKDYTLAPATETAGEFATDLLPSDGKVTSDGASYFAFSSKGTKGFKLVDNDVTIPAKKGYLKVENAAGANFLSFDDETLGINAATAAAAADGKAYNMAGQRVSKAYKGLVIIGGKKYLNK